MSEEVMQDAVVDAPEAEVFEAPITEDVVEGDQTESDDFESEDEGKYDEFSKRVGPLMSAERKRLQAKHAQDIQALHEKISRLETASYGGAQSGNENIQDPYTGAWVHPNSVQGQIILRDYQRMEFDKQTKNREIQAKSVEAAAKFDTKLQQGYLRFDGYEQAYETVNNLSTTDMVEAMAGTDNPASIVNYLGKKPEEIERIKKLSRPAQMKEIFKLEEKLIGKVKLTSSAPPATGNPNLSRNTVSSGDSDSISQREAAIRKRYGWS